MGSSGRVGRPPAGDSAATRLRILRAARVRFARDGFRATTNRLIADDVGITAGAIYHYVDSKAALYAAVYCETVDEVYTEFEKAAAEHGNLRDQYSAVLRRAHDLQIDDPSIPGFIVAVAQETQRHPDLLDLLTPQRGRHSQFFTDLAARAVDRGEMAPGVDPQALADLISATFAGLARMSVSTGDPMRYLGAIELLQRQFDGALFAT